MNKLLSILVLVFLCTAVFAQAPLKRPERKAKAEKEQVVKPRKANKTKITSSVKPVKEVKVDTRADSVLAEQEKLVEPKRESKSVSGIINNHEYVDLGLPSGIKWATMNVGASYPEDYGHYFAWGEIFPKENYSWNTYNVVVGTSKLLKKYCTDNKHGIVDNCKVLVPSDDVASVMWGGSWRMPTLENIKELISQCEWLWTEKTGTNGMLITGPNGNSLFLPAAGYYSGSSKYCQNEDGGYWSVNLEEDNNTEALGLAFFYLYKGFSERVSWLRFEGRSVRPVSD